MASRIPVGAPYPIATTFYIAGTETPVNADAGVTYTVTHVNGTVLATGTATNSTAVGVYTTVIPPQPAPADVVVKWVGTFSAATITKLDYLSIVGGFMAELSEIRALDGLSDPTTYPTAQLIDKREAAETLFEQATGRHWTPKYAMDKLDGDATYRRAFMPVDQYVAQAWQTTRRIGLSNENPQTLLSVSIDDGSGSGPQLQSDLTQFSLYPTGEVERSLSSPGWPRGIDNVVIEYVHGLNQPPRDLKNALLKYVRYLVLNTNNRIPDRAMQMQSEFGSIQLSLANGWQRPTGIPEVDAVLLRYGNRLPAVA